MPKMAKKCEEIWMINRWYRSSLQTDLNNRLYIRYFIHFYSIRGDFNSTLRFGPSFAKSVNFLPCDLVRHFPGPSFSCPAIWSFSFHVRHFHPLFFFSPNVSGPAFSVAPSGLSFFSIPKDEGWSEVCVIKFAYQFNQNGPWIWVQSLVFYYIYA